ncbi:MAG TPA: ATP-grasp domain-containing protein [Anaerohalosphaeraceae bacterium]|nr:ATP-grasp domain-containing protein [Anaerohalosphaeraceae bacterium]HRT51061.1 ATP-grasp domain-containing protein [Anaerohalosphaeraceae bacterium]HRT87076.1 ATP-grasp domain-containing protein [Anaerohalosphaeraceae bacterium]
MNCGALILHNRADPRTGDGSGGCFVESQAGVLNEVKAVAEALETLNIAYAVDDIARLDELPEVLARRPERVIFNLVEELPGDIRAACYVPAICRTHGRAVTGNGTSALLLAQNKWQCKAVLHAAGVTCPAGITVFPGQTVEADALPHGRYFVKPAYCDASEGIDGDSVVDWPGRDLAEAVRRIHERFAQPAIVEQFIAERELNVSVLQKGETVEVLAIAEIDFSAFEAGRARIVDYAAKWHADSFAFNNTPRMIPAPISDAAAECVRRQALGAWHAIGCSGYARVDFRMDDAERTYVIEVNPNPDISPDAGFAAALEKNEINYESFVQVLYDNALTEART